MSKTAQKISVIALGLLVSASCSPIPAEFTPQEADKRFIAILENDLGYPYVLRRAGNTLWIYLPSDKNLYAIKGGQKDSVPGQKNFSLQFIDGGFADKAFRLEYDVVPGTKVAPNPGLSTQSSPEISEHYNNLVTAITRVYLSAQEPPMFFVLVMADIQNGIEAKTTFFLDDLKRRQTETLSPEESYLRMQTDVSGDQKIVGDTKGTHLEIKEVTWPDFLTKQMIARVQFKFQRSDFPPEENPENEIVRQAAFTLLIYNFKDYERLVLSDLRNKTEKVFSQNDIEGMRDSVVLEKDKDMPEGKIITLDLSDFWKAPDEDAGENSDAPVEEIKNFSSENPL